ncbi:putative zinc finger (CCCH type) protein [Neospora caninum Liverpool]|uniref:Putative zinc finger (CCCH type) protein n=1 Tax=Neospora caninum (strain Liverpool) TaxID=572307 RepID=F0VH98_NEOCL|nr:putative zinc finger (CCCH type) protein [Neospora caninum Liverpool]CBZ53092.1 putative zinc finger (CCCH type) protein [Neospora caninum Liverpool]CEL67076.1 TPA: zinc finger (CCCH type) protein, putative [Neospora caninum Liverpool]|eukprot:XP_003883124.1 putative zinc finger (CCCH type) protein [Neospora caninum Liverpool]
MEGPKEVPVSGVFAEGAHFQDGRADPAALELDSSALTRLNLFVKFYKTKICPFYKKKRCEWGHDCKFAHGRKELRSGPDLSKTRMCPSLQRQGGAEQSNEIRRRVVSMDKPALLPISAITPVNDGTGSSIPEPRQFGASLPPARHAENEEVEFCFRFWVPRGAVVRLKSLQPEMDRTLPACEENVADSHRLDTGVDAALFTTLATLPPGVPRMVPDYPSKDVAPFGVAPPSFPQDLLNSARGPIPQVQPQADMMPIDLLPKFLSATLDVETPTSEREAASPSSGGSSSEFFRDFPCTPSLLDPRGSCEAVDTAGYIMGRLFWWESFDTELTLSLFGVVLTGLCQC